MQPNVGDPQIPSEEFATEAQRTRRKQINHRFTQMNTDASRVVHRCLCVCTCNLFVFSVPSCRRGEKYL